MATASLREGAILLAYDNGPGRVARAPCATASPGGAPAQAWHVRGDPSGDPARERARTGGSEQVSTSAATGFCRVTVVAPDSRIDVALPEDIAVADVYPEILRLTGQTQPAGAPTGYHLVRRDGTVLDGARSLAAQQVLDGEVLRLRPFAESLPPAVFDDVSDAVASAVTRDRHPVERRPAARRRARRRRPAARPHGLRALVRRPGPARHARPAGHHRRGAPASC